MPIGLPAGGRAIAGRPALARSDRRRASSFALPIADAIEEIPQKIRASTMPTNTIGDESARMKGEWSM
jgi:hypothetical protein